MLVTINTVNRDSNASTILDLIRFFVAALVVLFHGRLEIIPGYEAVMVFFVISGFFISSSVIKSISEDRWSWKTYLIARFTRLWLVLIPALILAYIWLKMRIIFFDYDTPLDGVLDWEVFLGNVFFLQGIVSPVYGLNGPLWSLSYEFWYYMLFPCIVHIFYAKKSSLKLMYLAIVLGLSILLGKQIMLYFPVWLFGSLIVLIKPVKIKRLVFKRSLLVFSILYASVSINLLYLIYKTNHSIHTFSQLVIDYNVGISFAFLLYVIVSFYNKTQDGFVGGAKTLSENLAGFSYTLYLTHYPLLYFFYEFSNSLQNPIYNIIKGPMFLLIIFVYGWLISLVTEKQTEKVRRFIKNTIRLKKREIKKLDLRKRSS
ncbi:acyltransferase family protein [Metabacillus halosaccharovorans]|uniref:acyltransferase family protein n=1 Tax=Metabacillus halosaccharovorans TaxID=930124 RepID=UPI00403DCDE5